MYIETTKEKPLHNYVEILAALKKQVLVIPQEVIDFAYKFKDLCESDGDKEETITVQDRFPLREGFFHGEYVHRNFEIKVKVHSYSVYHNDTDTDRDLTVTVDCGYGNKTEKLPWNKETNVPAKSVGRRKLP
jgi:hypothetical protein